VDRLFWVGDGRQADFEVVFAVDGIWSELIGNVAGYLGLEVASKSQAERQYRVLDFWKSHTEFERFREARVTEIEKFNLLLANEGLVVKQELAGTYYETDGDDGGLVSAQS
jgi:hypothetical protein